MVDNIKYGFGKYIWIIGVISLLGGGSFFAYLESIGLQIECEDKVCKQGVECPIDCSVYNPTYQSQYIFNYDNWKITFTPEIEEFKLYAKYYGKWRFTNFTKETRFPNIPDDKLYTFVFPRRSTKYFQIRVILNSTQKIKWDFGSLDPVIVGYDYIYENLSEIVSIKQDVITEVKSVYITKNDTWSKAYNQTTQIITGYKTEYYQKTGDNILDRIGVKVNDKEYIGWYDVCEDGWLVHYKVNPGDRNREEFCRCRHYTIQKGVCEETDLLK